MSVSRAVLLKVKMVGRSSILRLLLVPLGHTSTTAEADNLQIWSGKAVKAHHSENNLTSLPKREKIFAKLCTTWKGFASQTSNTFNERRVYFLFASKKLLLKLALSVEFITPILIDEVHTKLLVCCEPVRHAVRWRHKENIACTIHFFILLVAFCCCPIWRQNEYAKDLRKQLYEISCKGAFASLSQYKVQ